MYLFKGLWLGIVSALVVQVLSLSIITLVTNWDKEVIRNLLSSLLMILESIYVCNRYFCCFGKAKKAKYRVGHSDKEVTEAEASII